MLNINTEHVCTAILLIIVIIIIDVCALDQGRLQMEGGQVSVVCYCGI